MPGKKKIPQKESIKAFRQEVAALKKTEKKLEKNAVALLMAHQELRGSLQRQKMLYEALQESEERFRELTETIQEVFWLTDWETNKILYISPAYETVFGQSCQSLYDDSKSWSKHIHPDYKDKIVEAYAKNATKGTYEMEYPLIHPNKRIVWVREMAFPIKDKKGKVIRMAGYSVDVTKRKKAEEKLRLSDDILHEVSNLVIVANDKGNITYCAPSAEKILGYKPEELLGNKWWEKTFIDKKTADKKKKRIIELRKSKDGPEGESFERETKCSDGTLKWFLWQITFSGDGLVIAVGHDITHRKKTEQELQKKNTELDNFVYKASHDLKGPLASIRGVLNLATKEIKDESALQYLGLISKSTKRLDNILTELLEISTITQGTVELQLLDIEKLVKEVVESLQHVSYAENVSLKLNFCEKKEIYSDRKLLASVIQNLVDNAMKYKNPDAARPFVSVKVSEYEKGVKIIVKDNGLGIPSSMRKEGFEMFFRGTDDIEGTGLGLYIVSKAVEKLGGKIEMRSKEKKGTEFTVYLPN